MALCSDAVESPDYGPSETACNFADMTAASSGSEKHSKHSGGICRKAPTSLFVFLLQQLPLASIFVQEGLK